jgi:hypothetical protein
MKIMSFSRIQESREFAKRAAEHFLENQKSYTFAESDPEPGGLFAIRWNSFTVLVVKLDETFEPECWPTQELINAEFPQAVLRPLMSAQSSDDRVVKMLNELAIELNCRREHGAKGGSYLLYFESKLKEVIKIIEATR